MKRKQNKRHPRYRRGFFSFEQLEDRRLLSGGLLGLNPLTPPSLAPAVTAIEAPLAPLMKVLPPPVSLPMELVASTPVVSNAVSTALPTVGLDAVTNLQGNSPESLLTVNLGVDLPLLDALGLELQTGLDVGGDNLLGFDLGVAASLAGQHLVETEIGAGLGGGGEGLLGLDLDASLEVLDGQLVDLALDTNLTVGGDQGLLDIGLDVGTNMLGDSGIGVGIQLGGESGPGSPTLPGTGNGPTLPTGPSTGPSSGLPAFPFAETQNPLDLFATTINLPPASNTPTSTRIVPASAPASGLLILTDGGGNEEADAVVTADTASADGTVEDFVAEAAADGGSELFGAANEEASDPLVGAVAGPVEVTVIHSAGEAAVTEKAALEVPLPAQSDLLGPASMGAVNDLDLAVRGLLDQLRKAAVDLTSRGPWYWVPWLVAAGFVGVAGEYVRRRLKVQKTKPRVPGPLGRLLADAPGP